MGLKIVAEGIESQSDIALLTQLDCDYVQGYYITKPLSAVDFIEWLSQFELHSNHSICTNKLSVASI